MCLIKNLIREDQIFGYPDNLIIEVDEENHENYDSDDKKEREDMFKKHNFKDFLGEIILHKSKLHEKMKRIK